MTETPQMDEITRLAQGVRDALSDSMVDRLTGTAGNALEVVDKLNEPDIRDGLSTLLDAVGTMHRTGALQTVIDAVYMLHAMRSAATDSMVDRAFAFIEHMANNLGTEDLATLAHEAKGALEDAIDSCNIPGGGGGLMGTMRMLSQKDTQEALRFMLSFSCAFKKRAVVLGKSPQA
ncbi:MAG: DUF1641 domain-containing protein [Phaeospirillum sp.]|nr:DUF1641 domain-containing protein [Phaeospirillum sp.]